MENLETANVTGSMPIPMAVNSNLKPKISTLGDAAEANLLAYYTVEAPKRYSEGIGGIIGFGLFLIEAKAKLTPAEWQTFTTTDNCPVSATVASRYMTIAEDKRITKRDNWPLFPMSWGALYEISLLTDKQFKRGLRDKTISPDVTIKEIRSLREVTKIAKSDEKTQEGGSEAPAASAGEVAEIAYVVSGGTAQAGATSTDEATEKAAQARPLPEQTPTGETRIIVVLTGDLAEQNSDKVAQLEQEIQRLLEKLSLSGMVTTEVR